MGGNEAHADAMKVLVVEDDPFVREMAVTGLENAGFVVTEAASGGEALNFLHAGSRWLDGGQGLPRALSQPARPVRDRLCGADAARPRRDHPLEAVQDGSSDRCPEHLGRLRKAECREPLLDQNLRCHLCVTLQRQPTPMPRAGSSGLRRSARR